MTELARKMIWSCGKSLALARSGSWALRNPIRSKRPDHRGSIHTRISNHNQIMNYHNLLCGAPSGFTTTVELWRFFGGAHAGIDVELVRWGTDITGGWNTLYQILDLVQNPIIGVYYIPISVLEYVSLCVCVSGRNHVITDKWATF